MKKVFLNTSLFILYLSLIFSNHGQDKYEFIPLGDKITQTTISSIIKDKNGMLWLGSSGEGIFKYNSLDFKNYKKESRSNENRLNSSFIHTLYQDKNNNIWAGTQKGLNVYDRNLDKFNSINLSNDNSKIKFAVHALKEFNDSILLIGTHHFGLYRLNTKTSKFKNITYKSNKPRSSLQINSIVKSSDGRYLVGTNHGLMVYDHYNEVLQLFKFDLDSKYKTIETSIESIIIDKDNSIWLGTSDKGLIKVSSNNEIYKIENKPITNKRILSLSLKNNGDILCGTENDGLFEIEIKSEKIINYKFDKNIQNGIKSNSIWSIFTDNQDRIWLGYYNNGIDVHNDNYNKFESLKSIPGYSNSLSSSSVTGIIKDSRERLWISTSDGGIDVYNIKNKEFVNITNTRNKIATGLNKAETTTIFKDSKGNILVGTWESGFFILPKNSNNFSNINDSNSSLKSNKVMSFAEDSRGILWIGTFFSGLYSYDLKKNKLTHHNSLDFKKYNINTSIIRKIIVDKKDNIWIGTRSGLYQIKRTNNSYNITPFNNKFKSVLGDNVNSTTVFSLFEDKESDIWIGSLDYGLFKYNYDNDKIEWYNNENGFIHESVSSITQDKNGDIWISGNKGLSKLDLSQKQFTNFNKNDGLLSNKFNYNSVYGDSEILYFGGLNGINFFDPNKIKYNQELPLVFLKNLKLSNELATIDTPDSPLKIALNVSKELTLSHDQSFFSIEYVGVNYTRSENNQYAYFMEGFNEKWNYVGSKTNATFTNVPPGNYTFMVKAANNDGLWNETPTKLNIKILPAWWETNIAWFFYLLGPLLLIFISYRIFSVRIKEKRTLKSEREEHKQLEALNSKKIQFFTNISHEFRTPLTLILNPLNDIIKSDLKNLSLKTKNKLEIIHKNSNRLSRLINELMDFRKLQFNKMSVNASEIDLIPFIQEVSSHFEDEANQKNIILSVDYSEKPIIFWGDPSMLEKIIFNLLSNAFKVTPLNGMVLIEIKKNTEKINFPLVHENNVFDSLEITIEDTGSGIKEENINKIFDRFYQVTEFDKQYYGGTGIGLEVVKNFIELHKGKIEVSSKLDIGTKFKIHFPYGKNHLKEINLENKKQELNKKSEVVIDNFENSENKTKNKTLLIVDDNSELRSYLETELNNDYNILLAENGKTGFELTNKYVPDLVITDVMMPVMDGLELCKMIKNDIRTSHIPIMMITAKGMEIDKIKGIDSGADVYLQKPFNMDVLKSHLKQLINSRKILFKKYFNGIDFSENTTSLDQEFMLNVLAYINNNINDNNLNVENLADELLLSRSKLYRKIKALTGLTANEFIRNIRLEKSKDFIENSEFSISEICYKVGFSSPSYFTKCFKLQYGLLPKEIRDNKEE
ncbi:MAG: Sensor histidine kinase TodS [Flavobacteriaceae bacterium]|nr:MAG: Sensor histidine kinase TodS [Flavobacteriaceae bacterium]